MHVSMLGNSYQYAFAPAQGMSGTLRANGRGYVCGLGASGAPMAASDLSLDQLRHVSDYMVEHSCTQAQAIAALGYVQSGSAGASSNIDLSKVTGTISQVTDTFLKMGLSIAQISNALKGRYPQQDIDTEIDKIKMKQYIPWAIGGAAVLIGLFLVMGTRRRR